MFTGTGWFIVLLATFTFVFFCDRYLATKFPERSFITKWWRTGVSILSLILWSGGQIVLNTITKGVQ